MDVEHICILLFHKGPGSGAARETKRGHDDDKRIKSTIQVGGPEQGLDGCGHHLGRYTAGDITIPVDTCVEAKGESSVRKMRIRQKFLV
ncbi:hypothetical protein E4U21_000559 [Claviceps maximensis]|nr:hypothetical protein E4U21_000559 [Claviceps maximensis]